MIKAIIFDCFGVVISDALEALMSPLRATDPVLTDAIVEILQAHNRGLITPEESNRQIAERLGMSYEQYRQAIDSGEVMNEPLLAYVKHLRKTYKIAMLSNIDGKGLRRRFEQLGLHDYFDIVVASGDIGFAKPEAEAYQITLERLGVRAPECVFVDDRRHYLDGAAALGIHTLLYQDFTRFKVELEALLADSQ